MQSESQRRKRVFSGVQPTGKPHIGNYLGAVRVWVETQGEFDGLFCVVDMHAVTLPEAVSPARLREKTMEVAALYLACGIDPARSTIFVQSHVPEHAELAWILTCVTPLGWLRRMTQFKAKAEGAGGGAGLLCYPILMAADILLYDTDLVPVGEDQKQHIELTREIARRFGALYGLRLRMPEAMIREGGSRIMGLDDPMAKMSKSVGERVPGHAIGLLDPPEAVTRAVMGAATDGGNEARFDRASAGVRNLLTIYQALTGLERPRVEEEFHGRGYALLKRRVAELVTETLRPVRERYDVIVAEEGYLSSVLAEGADRARSLAAPMMAAIREAVGFAPGRRPV